MSEPTPDNKASILLADDSKLVRFTAQKILGEEFDLHLAEDGTRAWELVREVQSIQLVLTDMQMPGLNGFQLLAKIRQSEDERIHQLPVIMVTGAEDQAGSKKRAMEQGATDFIAKPFDNAHLQARIRAHVGHQQRARSLMEQVNTDTVTGLLNREAFDNELTKDVAFAARHRNSLAVVLIQLDRYRKLFETIGRQGFDRIMRQVAALLQQSVRQEDTVSRAGLSHFLLSLPTADPDAASSLAHRIAETVSACDIQVRGENWPLSLSFGICTVAAGATAEADALVKHARDALEQATQKGNNQVVVKAIAAPKPPAPLSLDKLARTLQERGRQQAGTVPEELDTERLMAALKPLVSLLSAQQRRQLLENGD